LLSRVEVSASYFEGMTSKIQCKLLHVPCFLQMLELMSMALIVHVYHQIMSTLLAILLISSE